MLSRVLPDVRPVEESAAQAKCSTGPSRRAHSTPILTHVRAHHRTSSHSLVELLFGRTSSPPAAAIHAVVEVVPHQ